MRFQLLLLILLLSSFELLAQNWCKRADFPSSSRRNTNGFSLNGKGYVCLGGDNSSNTSGHFKDLEMYDPATDSWTSKADFPGVARRNGIAFTIDSFAFVGLGWNNSSNFDDIYRYNANSDIWDTITPYPGQGTRTPMFGSVNGKGYVGGGNRSTFRTRYKDFYEYDLVNDSWTQLTDFPFGNRGGGISFSTDSLIYFGLGYNGNSYEDDLWSYNPRTAVWTQLSSFPGSNRWEASCFKIDSNIVIVGGGSGGSTYSDYYEYDIVNDTWTSIIGFSAGSRSRGAYFAIGNKGYISTGIGSSNLKDTWVFTTDSFITSFIDRTICYSDSIVLNAKRANANYLWQDSSTNSSYAALDSGIYWVTTRGNNCNTIDSIQVNKKPEIITDLGSDTIICPNEQLILDASTTNASYFWSDNSSNPELIVKDSATYWVEINVDNCIKRDSINISYKQQATTNFGADTTLCFGDSLFLDASNPGASYIWQDSSTNATQLIKRSGIYWVDITLDNCIYRDSITVNYDPEVLINLGNDTSICPFDVLVLDAFKSNASYLWQDNSTNSSLTVNDSGLFWVNVNVNNCSKRDSIQVSLEPNITSSLGADTVLCSSDSLLLDVTLAGATYSWQDNSTGPTFIAQDSGIYWVDITLNKCTKRDSIIVGINPEISPNIGNDTTICPNSSILLDATFLTATYTWQDNSTGATFLAQDSGLYWVEVNLSGCIKRDSIEVSLKPEIPINLGNDTIICPYSSVLLDATLAGATYSWQDSSTGPTFLARDRGIYWVDVSFNNCTKRDSIAVAVKPKSPIKLGKDTSICANSSILLGGAISGASYTWQDNSTGATYLAQDSGIYWVDVSFLNCLMLRDSIEISTLPLPSKPLINQVGNNLSISENGFYQWYKDAQIVTGETDSVITTTSSGLYHCALTDTNGCSINSDTLSVIITSLEEYNDFGMVVYPNPTKGFLNIQFQDFKTIRSIEIFSVDGKQVYFDNNLGKHKSFQVNLSHLNKGLHLLKLRFNDSNKVMKLMIE